MQVKGYHYFIIFTFTVQHNMLDFKWNYEFLAEAFSLKMK